MVGNATAKLFGIKKIFDTDETKSTITLADAARCHIIFICLPTPFVDEVGYRTDDIFSTIRQIEEYGTGAVYVMRSTVWPGFAVHLQRELGIDRVISNPEFLSEESWEKDIKHPPFILLGGLEGVFLNSVKALYEARIKSAPVILTDNTTAELAKLSMNSFFSTKVIFANQLYDEARKLNANYETVREILERHPFGPRNHFKVWFRGKRGVNGKCLPKDTNAMAYYTGHKMAQEIMKWNQEYIYQKDE